MERVTFSESFEGKPGAFQDSVAFDTGDGIVRAGREKAAARADKWAES